MKYKYSNFILFLIYVNFALSKKLKEMKKEHGIKYKDELGENILQLAKNYSNVLQKENTKEYSLERNSIYKDLIKIKESQKDAFEYDVYNRMFLRNIFNENEDIVSWEILTYRALARNDNGFFSTHLILLAFKNKIRIYDLFNNLLCEKEFSENNEINDLFVFHQQDEVFLYLLTDDSSKIRKFKLLIRKFDKKIETYIEEDDYLKLFKDINMSTEGEKITIRSFKDNVNAYDITFNYKKNMNKFKWSLEETNTFELSKGQGEVKIKNVILNINKGVKSFFSFLSNSTMLIFNEDLRLIKKFDFYSVEKPFVYQNFLSYFSEDNRKSIIFTSIDNPNVTLLNCSFSDFESTNKNDAIISNYILDSFSHLVYVLMNDGTFLIVAPRIFYGNKNENSNFCTLLKQVKLNIDQKDILVTHMEILRKDLIINTNEGKLLAVDLTDFEAYSNFTHIEIKTKQIYLEEFQDKYDILLKNESFSHLSRHSPKFVFCKFINGFYFLIRQSDTSIYLFEDVYPSGKLKGSEELGFNFKIPIIFIALLILFFYHYFKKKTSVKDGYEKDKEEILNKLKQYGVLNSKNNKKFEKEELSEEDAYSEDEDENEKYQKNERKFKRMMDKKNK